MLKTARMTMVSSLLIFLSSSQQTHWPVGGAFRCGAAVSVLGTQRIHRKQPRQISAVCGGRGSLNKTTETPCGAGGFISPYRRERICSVCGVLVGDHT